jgi:hypothetical protein
MKTYNGHLYETCEDWHPVVIRNTGVFWQDFIARGQWLGENCTDGSDDYDAWCYPDDELTDPYHRTIYFFRDQDVAFRFSLRWS